MTYSADNKIDKFELAKVGQATELVAVKMRVSWTSSLRIR